MKTDPCLSVVSRKAAWTAAFLLFSAAIPAWAGGSIRGAVLGERQPAAASESAWAGEAKVPVSVPQQAPSAIHELADDFNTGKLDERKWLVTRKSDFAEFAVDIVMPKSKEGEGQLRLRLGTIGTDDNTVKFLGVASRAPLDLSNKKRLALDFDWNKQSNGCYLTGAIYLCPSLTKHNPADEPQWLRLEYIGVPPGKNARAAVWLKDEGAARWLYDEGWPQEQRIGRTIERPHIEIHLDNGRWELYEDGKLLYESGEKSRLPFDKAYLYLQISSHSNYAPREIFFDNVTFGRTRPSRLGISSQGPQPR